MIRRAARRLVSGTRVALVGGGLFLFLAMALVNVLSFLVHVVVTRKLSPGDYGGLAALLGLILVLSVPAAALQASVTQRVAMARGSAHLENGNVLPVSLKPLLASAVLYGGSLFAALLFAAPLLTSFLRLPSAAPAILLAAWAIPAAIGLVPRAVLIGELRYGRVGGAVVLGATVRLGLTWLLSNSHGLTGAVAAAVLGEVASALLLLDGMRQHLAESEDATPLRIQLSDVVRPMTAFAGFWLFTAIDTIMSRRLLPEEASGVYAAASVAAKAAMFLPGAVSLIAFPRFAETDGAGVGARAALFKALAVVAVLSLGMAIGIFLFAAQLVSFLFGEKYSGSAGPLRILVIGSAAVGAWNVLMHFFIASRRGVLAGLSWAGCCGVATLSLWVRPSAEGLAIITTLAGVATLLLAIAVAVGRPSPPLDVRDLEIEHLWQDRSEVEVSVVVPYYNPGAEFTSNIVDLLEVLQTSGVTHEVIAVSDGSTDGSTAALLALESPALVKVDLPNNRGKGAALRVGLARGRGRYIGFIDADGDIDCRALREFIRLAEMYEPDVILGSKRHPMSSVVYPPIRRVYSWGYQQIVRFLFRLNIRDSQTGIKLIRRDVLATVLPRMVEKRFAFDLELFVVAHHLGFKKFFEAPITIRHQFHSTVSRRAVTKILLDTMAIFYRLRLIRYYDLRHRGEPESSPRSLECESLPTVGRGA